MDFTLPGQAEVSAPRYAYEKVRLLELDDQRFSLAGTLSQAVPDGDSVDLTFDLSQVVKLACREAGSGREVTFAVMKIGRHVPLPNSSSASVEFKSRRVLRHTLEASSTYAIRSENSAWVRWVPDLSSGWEQVLDLRRSGTWACTVGGIPPDYHPLRISIDTVASQEDRRELFPWSSPTRVAFSTVPGDLNVPLAPGNYIATLHGIRGTYTKPDALGTVKFEIRSDRVTASRLEPTSGYSQREVSFQVQVATERIPWNGELWLEGPGKSGLRVRLFSGRISDGLSFKADILSGPGLYRVAEPVSNYCQVLSLDDLVDVTLRIPPACQVLSLDDLVDVTLRIPPAGRIDVSVVDHNTGQVIRDAAVRLLLPGFPTFRILEARQRAVGEDVRFDVPAGQYAIEVEAEGYEPVGDTTVASQAGSINRRVVRLELRRALIVRIERTNPRPGWSYELCTVSATGDVEGQEIGLLEATRRQQITILGYDSGDYLVRVYDESDNVYHETKPVRLPPVGDVELSISLP